MKKNYIVLLVVVILLAAVGAYLLFKNNTPTHETNLDSSYNGQTINVKTGDLINISLSNPGSGGYQFDDPEFNTNLLKMLSHNHTDPKNNQMPGSFGEDQWKFKAIKSGQTDIVFYISRPWEQQKEANFKITVNIE